MVPRERFRETVERAIETFDLGELAERRVDRMSMGQRQRLRIAMTFLPEPEVVLLDEPLTSLDAEGRCPVAGAVESGDRPRRGSPVVLAQRRTPRHGASTRAGRSSTEGWWRHERHDHRGVRLPGA